MTEGCGGRQCSGWDMWSVLFRRDKRCVPGSLLLHMFYMPDIYNPTHTHNHIHIRRLSLSITHAHVVCWNFMLPNYSYRVATSSSGVISRFLLKSLKTTSTAASFRNHTDFEIVYILFSVVVPACHLPLEIRFDTLVFKTFPYNLSQTNVRYSVYNELGSPWWTNFYNCSTYSFPQWYDIA